MSSRFRRRSLLSNKPALVPPLSSQERPWLVSAEPFPHNATRLAAKTSDTFCRGECVKQTMPLNAPTTTPAEYEASRAATDRRAGLAQKGGQPWPRTLGSPTPQERTPRRDRRECRDILPPRQPQTKPPPSPLGKAAPCAIKGAEGVSTTKSAARPPRRAPYPSPRSAWRRPAGPRRHTHTHTDTCAHTHTHTLRTYTHTHTHFAHRHVGMPPQQQKQSLIAQEAAEKRKQGRSSFLISNTPAHKLQLCPTPARRGCTGNIEPEI